MMSREEKTADKIHLHLFLRGLAVWFITEEGVEQKASRIRILNAGFSFPNSELFCALLKWSSYTDHISYFQVIETQNLMMPECHTFPMVLI